MTYLCPVKSPATACFVLPGTQLFSCTLYSVYQPIAIAVRTTHRNHHFAKNINNYVLRVTTDWRACLVLVLPAWHGEPHRSPRSPSIYISNTLPSSTARDTSRASLSANTHKRTTVIPTCIPSLHCTIIYVSALHHSHPNPHIQSPVLLISSLRIAPCALSSNDYTAVSVLITVPRTPHHFISAMLHCAPCFYSMLLENYKLARPLYSLHWHLF